MKKNPGFTLAEILITIAIIGVIAALTIPLLIRNYQKQVTITALKKAYSELNQAISLSVIDNGDISTWDMKGDNETDYKVFAEKYFTPYLSIAKHCRSKTDDCWAEYCYNTDGTYDTYFSAPVNTRYSVMLNSGVTVGFWPRESYGITEIYLDINGKKGPNRRGIDLFVMIITKRARNDVFALTSKPGLYFYGSGRDRNYLKTLGYPCSKSGSYTGTFCGALIMVDGWEIRDDYPWDP